MNYLLDNCKYPHPFTIFLHGYYIPACANTTTFIPIIKHNHINACFWTLRSEVLSQIHEIQRLSGFLKAFFCFSENFQPTGWSNWKRRNCRSSRAENFILLKKVSIYLLLTDLLISWLLMPIMNYSDITLPHFPLLSMWFLQNHCGLYFDTTNLNQNMLIKPKSMFNNFNVK